MGKVPSLTGGPARQAAKAAVSGPAMPKRGAGKPGKSVKGSPGSVPVNKATKQPRGRGKPSLTRGTVKGISRKGVANVKDMGI